VGLGGFDVFVTSLNASASTILYSTYLGGHDVDWPGRIAVDAGGRLYVNGATRSSDFPIVRSSRKTIRGFSDAFVAQLDPVLGQLTFSALLGGSGNEEQPTALEWGGIALLRPDELVVTGVTNSPDFPVRSLVQAKLGGEQDAYVTRLDLRAIAAPTVTPPPSPTPIVGRICDFAARRVPAVTLDNAVANPETIAGWNERCNPNVPPGPANGLRTWLSLRNVGVPYDPQFNPLVYKCGCP
jgi:hypothetical protein